MKKYLSLFIGLALFSVAQVSVAQIEMNEMEQDMESIIDAEESDNISETDLIQIAENLEILRDAKVNLNNANEELLTNLFFLNAFQINNLIQFRKRYGAYRSYYELTKVPGMDKETILKLLDYTYLGDATPYKMDWKKAFTQGRHNVLSRVSRDVQLRRGYLIRDQELAKENPGQYYLGDPYRVFVRHRYNFANRVSFGFAGEKDAYEPWGGEQSPLGFDFMSGHIALMNIGKMKSFIIGDYHAQFGQGLALWTNFAFGKSPNSLNTQRFGRGFMAYNGLEENRFYRGVATTWGFGNLDVSVFYSNKRLDGAFNISQDSLEESALEVSSVRLTGLHRTPNEIAGKDQIGLESFGAHVHYTFSNLKVGVTAVENRFEFPIVPSNQLYRQFTLQGTRSSNYSADYQYFIKGAQFFGEIATTEQGALALQNGAYFNLDDRLTFTLLHRHYDKAYRALFNAPFAEGNGNSGEKGLYLGVRWDFAPRWALGAYTDYYEFEWMRFTANAPSQGRDYLVQIEHSPRRSFNYYARIKYENRQINAPDEFPIRQMMDEERLNMRFHVNIRSYDGFDFASRIEYTHRLYNEVKNPGYLVFQDVRYSFKNIPLKLTARYALFDTDGFQGRIYAYEHDVLYAFSIPALFDRGYRFYALAQYSLSKRVEIWLRYAQTTYNNRFAISSGLNEVEGNILSEIKFQIRVKF